MRSTFKGQIVNETEKAIQINIIGEGEPPNIWVPKSALDTKQMPVDCLSNKGLQIFHIHQWFIDLKAKEPPPEEKFYMSNEEHQGPDHHANIKAQGEEVIDIDPFKEVNRKLDYIIKLIGDWTE